MLATNLREFALIQIKNGQAVEIERYTLAPSEQAFWDLCSQPRNASRRHGKLLEEFLRRTLLAATRIADPALLASHLASYAREARYSIDLNHDILELKALQETLEEALGVKFEGEKRRRFLPLHPCSNHLLRRLLRLGAME